MSLALVLVVSSFGSVIMGELPAIILNKMRLQYTSTFFNEQNTSITYGTYRYYGYQYELIVACLSKLNANCEMDYNTNDILAIGNYKTDPILSLHLAGKQTSFNLGASYQDQLIYYEYEDGDYLDLTCSMSCQNSYYSDFYYHYFSFGNEIGDCSKPLRKNIQLRFNDNNTIHECNLLLYVSNEAYEKRRVSILFRIVTLTSKTETEASTTVATNTTVPAATSVTAASTADTRLKLKCQTYEIIIAVLALFYVILIVCFVAYITVRKYRKRRYNISVQQLSGFNNGEYSAEPPQLLYTDSKPAAENSNSLYSNVHELEAKETPELNYAFLDISPSKNVLRKNDTNRVIYTEIKAVNKKNRI